MSKLEDPKVKRWGDDRRVEHVIELIISPAVRKERRSRDSMTSYTPYCSSIKSRSNDKARLSAHPADIFWSTWFCSRLIHTTDLHPFFSPLPILLLFEFRSLFGLREKLEAPLLWVRRIEDAIHIFQAQLFGFDHPDIDNCQADKIPSEKDQVDCSISLLHRS